MIHVVIEVIGLDELEEEDELLLDELLDDKELELLEDKLELELEELEDELLLETDELLLAAATVMVSWAEAEALRSSVTLRSTVNVPVVV